MTYRQPTSDRKVLNPARKMGEDAIFSEEISFHPPYTGQMKGDFLCLQQLITEPPRA